MLSAYLLLFRSYFETFLLAVTLTRSKHFSVLIIEKIVCTNMWNINWIDICSSHAFCRRSVQTCHHIARPGILSSRGQGHFQFEKGTSIGESLNLGETFERKFQACRGEKTLACIVTRTQLHRAAKHQNLLSMKFLP